MRKLTFMLMCIFALFTANIHADNEKPIQVSQLPAAAQEFIKQHFPDREVALAKMETEFMSKSYEVIFANGEHVDFDSKGNWEEVDCKLSSVPDAVVPAPIRKYITENYPEETIRKIEKDHREYEVKLSNRVELSFDLNFNLTDIDL